MSDSVSVVVENRPRNGDILWCDGADPLQSSVYTQAGEQEQQKLRDFMRDGYLVVKGAVSHQTCDAVVDDYHSILQKNAVLADLQKQGNRLPNFHTFSTRALRMFTEAETALRYQDLILGYRTSIYTSLYFEYGTQQPIHRDVPVFRTAPENFYLGVWFALEDATPENGALRVMKGGHVGAEVDQYELAERHTNDISQIDAANSPLWGIYQSEVARLCTSEGMEEISVPLEKGDVLIWHPLLPHGGGQILSPERTRHSMVFHTVPEGCPVYKMDVFFNREKAEAEDLASWQYGIDNGRLYKT